MESAIVANGCFWCTEAVFKRLTGVTSVTSGYTGGARENPSYDQVSTGATGHAEAIEIVFDPKVISYDTLLSVFFATHDPTTQDRQGADVGTQYRSAIFYQSDAQKNTAEEKIKELTALKTYKDPIVTEIVKFTKFYPAENYHKNYYDANRSYPYCRVVIDPKVKKLLKEFSKDVKEEYKEP